MQMNHVTQSNHFFNETQEEKTNFNLQEETQESIHFWVATQTGQ